MTRKDIIDEIVSGKVKPYGTIITKEDILKAYADLDKANPKQLFSSAVDFESSYMKSKVEIFKELERIKYLEVWRKVKREFPFVNKM